MNSFMTSIVIGVVAIFAATSAQQGSCGCAPQPTVIQLSCGGGQPNKGPYHPPPPPPQAFTTAYPAWTKDSNSFETTTAAEMDLAELESFCTFDKNGNPTSHPPGGFPQGFAVPVDSDGIPHPIVPTGYPVPPNNWDGRNETLGFSLPQPGTPHYNMLMCYPMPVATAPGK